MASKKEKIVPETLVGASEEQSNQSTDSSIITEFEEEFNTSEKNSDDYFREM